MDGGSRGRYLSLCTAHDSSQRRAAKRVWRDGVMGRRKRKGGSVSADYLSTSVINGESGVLAASLQTCTCAFENQMAQTALE